MIQCGYKFRIYPTEEQKNFFLHHFGCCRFIYNYLLDLRKRSYEKDKIAIGTFESKKQISVLKKKEGYAWLRMVNSQSLQEASLDLGKAFVRFFKKLGGYPKFKKKGDRETFKVPQNFLLKKSNRGNWFLLIPKLSCGIKVKVHREVLGKIKQITISREPSGRYYIGLSCIAEQLSNVKKPSVQNSEVGIDLGLHSFIVTSNEEKKEAPKFLKKAERKLKSLHKRFSKKIRGSCNRKKSKIKLAKKHEKVANQRKDFLHKATRELINENQVIYIEDLHVKGMMKNRHLAKSIADAGFGEFARQLKYKCTWGKRVVIQIGRFEPSSKLCHKCLVKNNDLKLHHRYWTCKNCRTFHDRDINAAKNILRLGQGMPKVKPVERTTAVFSFKRTQVDSMKQEPSSNLSIS